MIRVLITDDDKLARKGLISIMPWAAHNMEVVGEAANGKKALEFLAATPVDLVFVDLAMPVLSGIDMMQEARRLYPELQFVVLTFHEDFEYVQATFRIGGVIDYLSKARMDMEDCDAIFERIEQKIAVRDSSQGEPGLVDRTAGQPDEAARQAAQGRMDATSRTDAQGRMDATSRTDAQGRMDANARKDMPGQTGAQANPEWERDWLQMAQEWNSLFWLFDEEDFESLIRRMQAARPSSRRGERLLVRISTQIETAIGLVAVPPDVLRDADDMEKWLRCLRQDVFDFAAASPDQNSMTLCMLRAVRHVELHIDEPLHADAVATFINFSRSYFSQCFKKTVGRTFNELVRRKRMNRARTLLSGTDLSVTRIAAAVGYGDVKYFSQQFHREAGCLPTEYRIRNGIRI